MQTETLRAKNQAALQEREAGRQCPAGSVHTGAGDHACPSTSCLGDWCYYQPGDSQHLLDRQLSYRDAALKADPEF